MKKPLFIIAGINSGCGKTTVTLGIMAYLSSKGYRVQGYKVGPDFIDPGHHRLVTKRDSHNLDTWMIDEFQNKRILFKYLKDADVGVIEGVMGLFDGYSPDQEIGSTAHLSKIANIPIILVIDVHSMARSVAALVSGFLNFDKDLNIKGIIFNNVASKRHEEILQRAVKSLNIKIYGALPKKDSLSIPSRHLGLITEKDFTTPQGWLKLLTSWIEENLNVDEILKDCVIEVKMEGETVDKKEKKDVRIGIAMDSAFCFYYAENLNLLEVSGAELVFFSPLKESSLPSQLNALYLGGGYPELYAEELTSNKSIIKEIKEFEKSGGIVYAECGGFMYLTKGIKTVQEKFYPLVGIFPFISVMDSRFRALGYREVIIEEDSILGPKNTKMRGHEFHYSHIFCEKEPDKIKKIYTVKGNNGYQKEGFCINQTLGSYIHIHFASNLKIPHNFIKSCLRNL